jgi:hypothetical protein
MRLITPRKLVSGYTADHWIDGNGSAIGLDPDPNTVTLASLVAAGRVFYTPKQRMVRGNGIFFAHSVDGTSITGKFWMYDDFDAVWLGLANAGTATTATNNLISGSWVADCKYYLQVTANAGVTKVAVTFR